MILVPFLPVHLEGFELQEAQAWLTPYLTTPEYIATLTAFGEAFSLIVNERVLGCGGLAVLSKNRAQAWALVHKDAGRTLFGATKIVKQYLDSKPYLRIETPVKTSFDAAHRWAKMLGFKNETPNGMQKWGDDGENYSSYARIKNG